MTQNKVYNQITDILIRVVAILGLPGVVAGTLFQTMGFQYGSVVSCVKAFITGIIIAAVLIFYVVRLTKIEDKLKRAKKNDIMRLARNFSILTLLMFVMLLLATSQQYLSVGIAGATACVIFEIRYLVCLKVLFKNED